MKKDNTVAMILKVYGILNGIASVILGFVMNDNLPSGYGGVAFVIAAAGVVFSFLLYALGEGLQLLEDIKNNTAAGAAREAVSADELPEL